MIAILYQPRPKTDVSTMLKALKRKDGMDLGTRLPAACTRKR